MYKYHLKSEFRRRLTRLHAAIGYFLAKDLEEGFNRPLNNLLPSLFSVYGYLWGKNVSDCYKKVFKDGSKNL